MQQTTHLSLWKGAVLGTRPVSSLRQIFHDTAADHRLTVAQMEADTRAHAISHPRQDFMWRARQVKWADGTPRYSLPMIGKFLGVDHSTVIHGVRAHEKRMGAN